MAGIELWNWQLSRISNIVGLFHYPRSYTQTPGFATLKSGDSPSFEIAIANPKSKTNLISVKLAPDLRIK